MSTYTVTNPFPSDWPVALISGDVTQVVELTADGSVFVGIDYLGRTQSGFLTIIGDTEPDTPHRSGVLITGPELVTLDWTTAMTTEITALSIWGHQEIGAAPLWTGPTYSHLVTTDGTPFTLADAVPDTFGTAAYVHYTTWDDGLGTTEPLPATNGLADDWYARLDSFAITGTNGADIILAVYGGRVAWIDGQKGDDDLRLIDGGGTLYGRQGHDSLHGFNNVEFYPTGTDGLLWDAETSDEVSKLLGGGGDDYITYASGHSAIRGGAGDDYISSGGVTSNTFTGEAVAFSARIRGGTGNDTIEAGGTKTFVFGDDGDDWIIGRAERAVLTGGTGSDTFAFNLEDGGRYRITDFEIGTDDLDITNTALSADADPLDGVEIAYHQTGANVGITLTQDGVTVLSLTFADHALDDIRNADLFG